MKSQRKKWTHNILNYINWMFMSPTAKRYPRKKEKGRKHYIQIYKCMLSTPYIQGSNDVKSDSVIVKNHFKPVQSTSFMVSDDRTILCLCGRTFMVLCMRFIMDPKFQ